MYRNLFIGILLYTATPAYAECNCIVNPLPSGIFDIKCDVPSIIVFTNTPPIYNKTEPPKPPVFNTSPPTPLTVTPPPTIKPPVINQWVQPPQQQPKQNNNTIGIDPETGRMIFK